MSYFQNIQRALDTRLNAFPTGYEIAWENTNYSPTEGTGFIRPTTILAGSEFSDLARNQNVTGIYQIDIFAPRGNGLGDLLDTVDMLCDHFRAVNTLSFGTTSKVYIRTISHTTRSYEDDWVMASVEVSFQCYKF